MENIKGPTWPTKIVAFFCSIERMPLCFDLGHEATALKVEACLRAALLTDAPWTSTSSMTWELVRNAGSQAAGDMYKHSSLRSCVSRDIWSALQRTPFSRRSLRIVPGISIYLRNCQMGQAQIMGRNTFEIRDGLVDLEDKTAIF